MSKYARVAVVTGANKGIGFAIVRKLALQYPSSPLNNGPLCLYLTARNESRGQAALEALRSDPQLSKAKVLKPDGGLVDLKFHVLDVSEEKRIDAFVDYLKEEHGEIDVVVNNAGIAMDGFDANVATTTLKTNYHGTVYATLRFLSILRPTSTSRIVNVASIAGALSKYPPPLRQRFVEAIITPDITHAPSAATALMREFEEGVKTGTHEKLGYPSAAYAVSKAGLIAATRAVARSVAESAKKRGSNQYPLINSCCPGWVNTDMSKGRGYKTIDQGAETPVLLALGDLQGKTGGFWQEGKESRW
uniref:Carbonyl reductase n=1 Tax=Schizophyllum commune (strain H4-8 / FGSC 9210) TaxID=578458 RepID=D8PZI4_SCHCM